MIALLLKGLESAINKLLRLDPDTILRIKKLEGKSVKIILSDWNFSFFVLPFSHGLQLLTDYHKQPNTIISGKLLGLMKTGIKRGTTTSLFDESITISGDVKTGEAIQDVLKNLDIDWEEQLSKVVGDSFAHPIAHHTKNILDVGKRSINSIKQNLAEYLHYESQQLPPPQAIENFIEAVGKLRDDVDRMEVRINRLMTRLSE